MIEHFTKEEQALSRKAESIHDTLLKSRDGYVLLDKGGILVYEMEFTTELSVVNEILDEHISSVLGSMMLHSMCQLNGGNFPFEEGAKFLTISGDSVADEVLCDLHEEDIKKLRAFYEWRNAEFHRQKLATEKLLNAAIDLRVVEWQ